MIDFPNVTPEIFSLNLFGYDLSLRWYAVSYIAGFVCAYFILSRLVVTERMWRYEIAPFDEDQIDDFITMLIVGVIFGGRLGYVLFYNVEYYLQHPAAILRVWDGGMSFHGGFLGVVVALLIFCARNGLQIMAVADSLAIASTPGLFFGRIANFINAELWGRPTDVPWGVVFPGESAQNCPGVLGPCARHPSQLYEALFEGLFLFIFLMLIAYAGGLRRSGLLSGLFLIGYGLARFIIEYYRVPDPQFFSPDNVHGYAVQLGEFGVTMGQALSIPMMLIGGIFVSQAVLTRR